MISLVKVPQGFAALPLLLQPFGGLKIDEVLNKDRLKIQHCKVTLTRISRDQVILGA